MPKTCVYCNKIILDIAKKGQKFSYLTITLDDNTKIYLHETCLWIAVKRPDLIEEEWAKT